MVWYPHEHPEAEDAIATAAEILAKYLDKEQLWHIAHQSPPIKVSSRFENPPSPPFTKGGTGGLINKMDGLCYKNVLATYTHLHALGTREWVDFS